MTQSVLAGPHPETVVIRVVTAFALLGTVVVLAVLFGGFFPGPHGMGHDYSFFLPDLLSNYYWAQVNGPWMPPWFTPAFCGGQPAFADPQSLYYSVPQLLAAFGDPVASIFWTLLVFGALGFLGCFLFLRQSMGTSVPAALVAGVFFALNGFFSHRMLIGHLAFHAMMLLPLLAWAVTAQSLRAKLRSPATWMGVVVGALVVAYWVFSGMLGLFVPVSLSLLAVLCLYGLTGAPLVAVMGRCLLSFVGGLALASAKIVGAFAYVQQFPRSGYELGGFVSTWDSVKFAFSALFLGPELIAGLDAGQVAMSRHEYEFSLTPVAGLLVILGAVVWLGRWLRSTPQRQAFRGRSVGLAFLLLLVMALPVVLNTAYGPQWQALLKSIPIIKSSSTLIRWFVVLIPVICVLVALSIDCISGDRRLRAALALTAIVAAVSIHFQSDTRFYAAQVYDPQPIQQAFQKARTTTDLPAIRNIAVMLDAHGNAVMPQSRNDYLAQGYSSLLCYNPIFGYRLEAFPLGTLHPGPALEVQNGYFNLKNPSCYLYPQENDCKPGTHFSLRQEVEARKFTEFRSFNYGVSWLQRLANGVSLAMVLVLGGYFVWIAARRYLKPRKTIKPGNPTDFRPKTSDQG